VETSLHDRLVERIRFVDGHAEIWRVFEDGQLFAEVVDALARPWESVAPTKVAGIEARGFIVGAVVASRLGAGFVAIRKEGSLFAGSKIEATSGPDYRGRQHRLLIRRESVEPADRVVLVDDWCEKGSQAMAAKQLIESCGATFLGVSVIVDQLPIGVASAFPRYLSLVRADELHTEAIEL
jgi:adenine phosphoribosyltransferase